MSAAERDPQAPEIRAWGKEHGWEVADGGRIPAALRSAWATASSGGPGPLPGAPQAPHPNGNGNGAGPVTFTVPDYAPPGPGAHVNGDAPAPEEAPEPPPSRSRWGKVADRVRRQQPPPRVRGGRRRVTLETLGGILWAGAAQLCARGEKWLPVANIMAFQAPVAGMVLEDTLKGTLADTVLQPVARLVETGSTAGALLGPPALVGLTCARPELYPVTRPLLAASMKEWVIVAGPKLRELRRREERYQAEMAELGGEDFALNVDEMIDAVFAPMFAQPPADAPQPG